jgi:hypothetical protein
VSFGPKTVTFVTLTETGVPDAAGVMTLTPTLVDVEGCMHYPLSASETPVWLTDIGTQIWNTIAPPEAAAIAAKTKGQLKVDGVTYEIVAGAQPLTDFSPDVFVVQILSKIQEA